MTEKNIKKSTKSEKKKETKKSKCSFMYIVLLLIVAMIGGASYFFYIKIQKMESLISDVNIEITKSALQEELEFFKKENQKLLNELNNNINKNKKIVLANKTQLQKISEYSSSEVSKNNILVLEVRSGLQIASWVIRYSHNIDAAVELLQEVYQQATLLTGDLANLKDTIKKDISEVQSRNIIDQAALFAKIESVKLLSEKFVVQPSTVVVQKKDDDFIPRQGWRGYIDKGIFIIKKLIVFKRHDKKVSPLISKENEKIVIQNLKLLLNQIQWAIIYRNTQIYQDTITQAINIIERNFSKDSTVNQTAITLLKELKNKDLNPPSHQLNSVKEINRRLQDKNQKM
ncbi:MAG: uroporphyrinogen-III C-methyltransferase [Legionellales bacterium]|nr:uroporphyrinogen-III C-methyltransferase [Legionellales bacterium]